MLSGGDRKILYESLRRLDGRYLRSRSTEIFDDEGNYLGYNYIPDIFTLEIENTFFW